MASSTIQFNREHHVQKRKSVIQQMPNSSSEDEEEHDANIPVSISTDRSWGTRHTLTLLGFLGFASSYSMRVNLSIAIVSMVNSSNSQFHRHDNSVVIACPELVPSADESVQFEDATTVSESFQKFNWSGYEQGIILGSFFYGYVSTQVPGGLIANRIGGKWVFGLGMLTTAIFSLLTPLAASSGFGYLVAVRIIQGLGEGVTNPAMHSLLSHWLPAPERSFLCGLIYAGTQIGTVLALPISGYLISNPSFSWPSVFYVFGLLGILWFIAWSLLIHDTPSTHPHISLQELQYIQSGQPKRKNLSPHTPWRTLLTSPPVLAILVAQTGHGWGLYTMLTELPTYMEQVLHFNIKQNAYLSALPYFFMWIVSVLCSVYADKLRASGYSTATVRKIFNTIAHWLPALLLAFAANSACNRTLTVALITLAISINGAAWASFQVNHIDLSPNHAAVMMGITNGFANLCGIAAPYVAGVIIDEGSSVARWRLIFYIAAAIYFIDNVIYLLFAEGDTQDWDSLDDRSINERIIHHGSGRVLSSRYAAVNSHDDSNDDEEARLLEP